MFVEELSIIKSDEIRATTARLLDGAPEYFWHVAASEQAKNAQMLICKSECVMEF